MFIGDGVDPILATPPSIFALLVKIVIIFIAIQYYYSIVSDVQLLAPNVMGVDHRMIVELHFKMILNSILFLEPGYEKNDNKN